MSQEQQAKYSKQKVQSRKLKLHGTFTSQIMMLLIGLPIEIRPLASYAILSN